MGEKKIRFGIVSESFESAVQLPAFSTLLIPLSLSSLAVVTEDGVLNALSQNFQAYSGGLK